MRPSTLRNKKKMIQMLLFIAKIFTIVKIEMQCSNVIFQKFENVNL